MTTIFVLQVTSNKNINSITVKQTHFVYVSERMKFLRYLLLYHEKKDNHYNQALGLKDDWVEVIFSVGIFQVTSQYFIVRWFLHEIIHVLDDKTSNYNSKIWGGPDILSSTTYKTQRLSRNIVFHHLQDCQDSMSVIQCKSCDRFSLNTFDFQNYAEKYTRMVQIHLFLKTKKIVNSFTTCWLKSDIVCRESYQISNHKIIVLIRIWALTS